MARAKASCKECIILPPHTPLILCLNLTCLKFKDCGESLITNGTVNTDRLSGYLEDELNKYLPTLNPTVKCAVVSLYRCLEYMKYKDEYI